MDILGDPAFPRRGKLILVTATTPTTSGEGKTVTSIGLTQGLDRIGKKLVAWNKDQQHGASLTRIRAQMAAVCAKLPSGDPARTSCDQVLGGRKDMKA